MLKLLTKKQKAVFQFIREKIENRGYGPTVREIGDKFGIGSPKWRDVPFTGTRKERADHARAQPVAGNSDLQRVS